MTNNRVKIVDGQVGEGVKFERVRRITGYLTGDISRWNDGMTAEKFVAAWIKSTFLIPKVLLFGNTNYYYSMLADGSAETARKRRFHRRGSRTKRYTISKQGVKNKRQKKKRYMDE